MLRLRCRLPVDRSTVVGRVRRAGQEACGVRGRLGDQSRGSGTGGRVLRAEFCTCRQAGSELGREVEGRDTEGCGEACGRDVGQEIGSKDNVDVPVNTHRVVHETHELRGEAQGARNKLEYLNAAYMPSESKQQEEGRDKLRSRERAKGGEDSGREKGARRAPGARSKRTAVRGAQVTDK